VSLSPEKKKKRKKPVTVQSVCSRLQDTHQLIDWKLWFTKRVLVGRKQSILERPTESIHIRITNNQTGCSYSTLLSVSFCLFVCGLLIFPFHCVAGISFTTTQKKNPQLWRARVSRLRQVYIFYYFKKENPFFFLKIPLQNFLNFETLHY
jgi:hypothetical protein